MVRVILLRVIEEHIGQPFARRELAGVGRGDALAALQHDEGGARDGVEGFDATVDDDGQAAEGDQVEVGFVALGHERPGNEDEAEQEEEKGKESLHDDGF